MAGYTYPYRSSPAYHSPSTDQWRKSSYSSDHVCRPVIIDAEGRKRPIVSNGPQQDAEFYVATTETIVQEHVLSPYVSVHSHTPFRPQGQLGNYEVVEERWHKPSSPVHSGPQDINEFLTKVQMEASKPKFGPFNTANWRQTKSTGFSENTGGHNTDWQKPISKTYQNDSHDDYFSKPGSPKKSSLLNNGGWDRPSHTTWGGETPKPNHTAWGGEAPKPNHTAWGGEAPKPNHTAWGGEAPKPNHTAWGGDAPKPNHTVWGGEAPKPNHTAWGGEAPKLNHTTWGSEAPKQNHTAWGGESPKSTLGSTSPNSTYFKPTSDINAASGYFKEPAKSSHTNSPQYSYKEPSSYANTADRKEPFMISQGGWVRPSATTWASPPDSNLSRPTSDINTAMGVLKDAAKPSVPHAPNSRYTDPGYTETINSTEAARRYKFNFPTRAYVKEDNYTTTIDSKEAARKYGGATV